jgi:hypothetical protein
MAKNDRRVSRRSGHEPEPGAAKQKSVATAGAKRLMAGRKGLRRRLRKLEGQLADAARQERKRLRRLERALWRRQRIEAAIDEIRTATALLRNAASDAVEKPASSGPAGAALKPVAKPVSKPVARTAAKPAAARVPAPDPAPQVSSAAAAAVQAETPVPAAKRPATAKRAPARRVVRPRSSGAAGSRHPSVETEPAPAPPTQG